MTFAAITFFIGLLAGVIIGWFLIHVTVSKRLDTYWIVGRNVENEWGWEFQGLYTTEDLARLRCEDSSWFIAPVHVNRYVPTAPMQWPEGYRPTQERIA